MRFLDSINKKLCSLEQSFFRTIYRAIGRNDLAARFEDPEVVRQRVQEEVAISELFSSLCVVQKEDVDIEGIYKNIGMSD